MGIGYSLLCYMLSCISTPRLCFVDRNRQPLLMLFHAPVHLLRMHGLGVDSIRDLVCCCTLALFQYLELGVQASTLLSSTVYVGVLQASMLMQALFGAFSMQFCMRRQVQCVCSAHLQSGNLSQGGKESPGDLASKHTHGQSAAASLPSSLKCHDGHDEERL